MLGVNGDTNWNLPGNLQLFTIIISKTYIEPVYMDAMCSRTVTPTSSESPAPNHTASYVVLAVPPLLLEASFYGTSTLPRFVFSASSELVRFIIHFTNT